MKQAAKTLSVLRIAGKFASIQRNVTNALNLDRRPGVICAKLTVTG